MARGTQRTSIRLLGTIALVLFEMVLGIPNAVATPGDLDLTFGTAGVVETELGEEGWAGAVTIQPDGKIVVVGYTYPDSTRAFRQFTMVRYLVDGSLDSEFGIGGVMITPFGRRSYATDVTMQSDDKIVVIGTAGPLMAVARYLPDGALDPDFGGGDGKATIGFGSAVVYGEAVVVLADGSIVVAGSAERPRKSWMVLARLTSQGSLDESFGTGGRVRTTLGDMRAGASDLIADSAGIVAVGWIGRRLVVARYTLEGVPDASFADGGIGRYLGDRCTSSATGITIGQDGRIVVAVHSLVAEFAYPGYASLLRLMPDGLPDDTFSGDGVTDVEGLNWRGAVAIQSDGKIVLGGGRCCGGGSDITFAVSRFEGDGDLDLAFGSAGTVLISSEWTTETASGGTDLALQDDGKIVLVGPRGYVSGFAAVRLLTK